ncbi:MULTISPECIES: DUF3159 domain-containing protein [unclassified Arthrobacter]|uniref:DUF3159 domain-containing protein n=1 Tax=unclassified Arthrobacter TaxID=235627 RepID=UPI001E586997|nr:MULTISPECIES: DUF3159 domain-containing protein [unclassified Arthrobacter]MCC9145111.1 DUF3159 domain-containing protein [Arthrobacter sp. zg-Y919]MDK1276339.1 DUF3159 domain-containing protein [Arthrobacter sp. zg.Y919]WIB02058.1 DUF3159 domain-containing protein [Arthrobacter sp. zg-Y919]
MSTPQQPDDGQPDLNQLAGQYAARSGVERRDDGQIDVLKSVGGVRGLAEAIVPGLLFTLLYTVGAELNLALGAAVAAAAVFSVANLVQRRPLMQSLTGVAGVAICAFVALRSGDGATFFVPGFYVNGAYILAFLVSIAVKWPVAGLLFGFIRGENLEWRTVPVRLRAYTWASWIIVAVFALRLAVQLPLYLAGNVAALGTMRLAMGVPLYALGLWLAWVVSKPSAIVPAAGSTGSASTAPPES